MEKLFYTAKEVSELLNYGTNKGYDIIKKLNQSMIEEVQLENKTKPIDEQKPIPLTFSGRISKDYFHKKLGIERVN